MQYPPLPITSLKCTIRLSAPITTCCTSLTRSGFKALMSMWTLVWRSGLAKSESPLDRIGERSEWGYWAGLHDPFWDMLGNWSARWTETIIILSNFSLKNEEFYCIGKQSLILSVWKWLGFMEVLVTKGKWKYALVICQPPGKLCY